MSVRRPYYHYYYYYFFQTCNVTRLKSISPASSACSAEALAHIKRTLRLRPADIGPLERGRSVCNGQGRRVCLFICFPVRIYRSRPSRQHAGKQLMRKGERASLLLTETKRCIASLRFLIICSLPQRAPPPSPPHYMRASVCRDWLIVLKYLLELQLGSHDLQIEVELGIHPQIPQNAKEGEVEIGGTTEK